jgi:predicted nuclease of predicted toxin-antitoxin system
VSLLFDQNLSRRLPALLASEFPGSQQVFEVGLATADDRTIWVYPATQGLTIVSKDADFAQLSTLLGSPPKVIWLRIGNSPTRDAVALLKARAADVQVFLADPSANVLELP